MNRAAFAAAAVLVLAACAKSEEASLVPPQEEGYNMVDPVGAQLTTDNEVALGEWTAVTEEDQPALQFGPAQAGALFSMRCGDAGTVLLQRHGVLSGPGQNTMAVEVGGAVQRLPAEGVPGAIPLLRATLPAGNVIGDRFGQGQGRITVRAGEGEPLIMPVSPMIGEFVRGCSGARTAGAPAGGTNDAATANAAAPANTAAPAAPAPAGNAAQGNTAAEARPSARTQR